MKILFLADAVFADKPGGSRVVARELARGLAARGHEITFLVARQNDEAPEDETHGNIRIVRYPGAGKHSEFVRNGQLKAASLAAETNFDIVHTHFAYASKGPSAALGPKAVHIRSFYGPWDAEGLVEDNARVAAAKGPAATIKAMLARSAKFRMRHSIEAQSLARSRAAIVLSEHSKREVLEFNYPSQNIHLIAGGVDTQRFTPADGRLSARSRLGLPAESSLLFTVRRLAPRMGLDNLITALKTVVANHHDVLLLIGGKGPEMERLSRLVDESGLQGKVRLLGFIPDDQLADYYRAADLFVLPTVALEGFGLVTVEALSCGTPVVGTPVGATPEILAALDKRLLSKSSDPSGLASAINEFLDGDWGRQLTPQVLRQYVVNHFTWDRHVDAVEGIYRQTLAAAGSV